MELKIQRSRWRRGCFDSFLLSRGDGKMCCLGFLAKACGAQDKDIAGIAIPPQILNKKSIQWPDGFWESYSYTMTSDTVLNLMGENDDPQLPEAEREERIIRLMKQLNVDVIFED